MQYQLSFVYLPKIFLFFFLNCSLGDSSSAQKPDSAINTDSEQKVQSVVSLKLNAELSEVDVLVRISHKNLARVKVQGTSSQHLISVAINSRSYRLEKAFNYIGLAQLSLTEIKFNIAVQFLSTISFYRRGWFDLLDPMKNTL